MHASDTEQISGDNLLVEQDVKAPGTEEVPARVKNKPGNTVDWIDVF
jgi:plastocyanin